jgi:hypothetical protein
MRAVGVVVAKQRAALAGLAVVARVRRVRLLDQMAA